MLILFVPAGLAVWPLYCWLTWHSGRRRNIRAGVGTFFFLQLVPSVWVGFRILGMTTPRANDAGIFLVALGFVSLVGSALVIIMGETALWAMDRLRRNPRAASAAGG
jgi:hypothetical protein